ncbi:MAG: MFS transporter [Acidiferrobacterales bacterium]
MPYWRLSGFYFFYFATLGAIVPYFSVYLRSVGFNAAQIGELMAIIMLSRIVAPYIWGWIADHQNQRMIVVRLAALLSAVMFAGVFFSSKFWWLALVMLAFSFFWNATLPQVEAATMSHLGGRASQYARVRLWGSIGFIITVVGLGSLFDFVDPWWLLPIVMILLGLIWVSSLLVPDRDMSVETEHHGPLLKVLFRPDVFAFLFACFLMQASHGPYYTFYTIYLSDFGYSTTLIGWLWALGVVCEIGVFILLHRIQRRLSLRWIMLGSCALAAVRWLLIGYFPQRLELLLLAQVLHAVTFGAYHAAAIEMVHNFFRGKHQTRGQAIYGSVSFGLGGALGSIYAGYIWDTGGAAMTFTIAAMLAAAATVVAWRWVHSSATY